MWGAEQPWNLLLAKRKGLAPTLCALKSWTNISTKCREKGMCLLQHWKHLFACRTQNCVIFHTPGCCESKSIPPTQLPNLGSPLAAFACPGCARIPVTIKNQVSFTLIKMLENAGVNISALAVLPEALLQLLCPYFIAATESWTKTQCQLVLASCSGANFVGLVFF